MNREVSVLDGKVSLLDGEWECWRWSERVGGETNVCGEDI